MEKMSRKKILHFKKIYKLSADHFFRSYIICLLMKNVIKKLNFCFPKKLYALFTSRRYTNTKQNCYFKVIYKYSVNLNVASMDINRYKVKIEREARVLR